jgi:transcriptional regulator of acetoin/glycerol metabolism
MGKTDNNTGLDRHSGNLVQLDGSWRRCKERYRFDRAEKPHFESLTSREVDEHCEPFEEYMPSIRSELEFAHSALKSANICASFSNMAGIILHYHSDHVDDADLKLERPGSIWAEGVSGTNGVGTCVVERRPTMVIGSNHYFRAYATLSCIAAPVLSADAEMVGVLNIASADPHVTSDTFALVAGVAMQTAERLSNQFFLNRFRKNAILKICGPGHSMLFALDDDHRIVGANKYARDLCGVDASGRHDLWTTFQRTPGTIVDLARGQVQGLRRLRCEQLLDAELLRPEGASSPARRAPAAPAGTARPSAPATAPAGPTIEQCLGPHPKMATASRLLRKVSGSSLPILLLGETGVGKDTLAKALHHEGDRREQPFVAFNCAAVPESLIDSELFGYGVGAFTGAKREGNAGRIKQADGGTLFLDEIGDIPLQLQTKLLRVLETGEISPLGSARMQQADFRIIAATNNNLLKSVSEGRFRSDLYYRLAGVVVELPPLRERRDIVEIAERLMQRDTGSPTSQLSNEAKAALLTHSWPGNIRELKFVLERARRICENGLVTAEDLLLPAAASHSKTDPDQAENPRHTVHEAEKRLIVETLLKYASNVNQAARALDMSRATLYRKMRQHNLGSQKIIS